MREPSGVGLFHRAGRATTLVLAAWLACGIAVVPLRRVVGPAAAALATLPILVTAWTFGTAGGVIAGALAFPACVWLMTLTGESATSTLDAGGLAGWGILLLGGAVVGRIRGLQSQIEKSRAEREDVEEALGQEIARERRVTRTLLETAEILSTTLRFDGVLERVLDQFHQVIPYDTASVFLIHGEQCQIAACRGPDRAARWQISTLEDVPHIQQVVEARHPVVLTDVGGEPGTHMPDDLMGVRSWMGVPVIAQDSVIGVLTMRSRCGAIDEETERLASALAQQAGMALENSRLYEQMRAQLRDGTILQEVTAAISSTLDADKVLSYVAHSLCEILQATSVEIFGVEEGGEVAAAITSYASERATEAERGLEPGRRERLDSIPGATDALERQQPVQMRRGDPHLDAGTRARLEEQNAAALLLLPMVIQNRALGFARVWDSGTARGFSRRQITAGRTLAHQTAIAMDNARLFEQTKAALLETRALYRTSSSLITQKNVEDILQTLVDEVVEALAADGATVVTMDVEASRVKSFVAGGPGSDQVVAVSFNELWNGLTGWALRERKPALSPKGQPDPREDKRAQKRRKEANCGSIIVAPLVYRDKPLGTMTVMNRPDQRDFTEKDVELMMAFANQAAAALENSRLIDETQHRANRLAGAAEVARHATAITDREQLLEVVVDLIREQFGFRLASVFLVDEAREELYPVAATEGFWEVIPDGYRQSIGWGAMGKAAESGKPVLITDVSESTVARRVGDWLSPSSLSVPIQMGGEVLGVLEVEGDTVSAFDENDQLALEIIADQIAIAYQNAELLSETRSRVTDLQLLHDVSLAAASSSHVQETLQAAVEALAAAWTETQIAIQLIDKESGMLRTKASVGYPAKRAEDMDLPLGAGITGWVAEHGGPVLSPNVREDRRYYEVNRATQSELCVPLSAGSGIIGTLNVESAEIDAFSLDDQRLLTTLASNLAMLIERARLFEEIEEARGELESRAEALEAANARLQELDRLKSEFLATMSHELRTPLNSVIGFSEVLMDGLLGEMPPDQQECVESIYTSGEHLLALINDVLDLSKIEAGHMELAVEPVDVRELVEDVKKTVRAMVEEKSQTFAVELEDGLPPLRADRVRLRQVLLNLLSNAHKFTSEKGEITLSCRLADKATMAFSVTDTGMGIKPEDQAIIFDEFRQASGSAGREVEGTGLGLAISKHLVEMHDGSIWLESEYGAGATFSFLVPLAGPSADTDGARDAKTIAPSAAVLVIEDDRAFNNLLAVYLRQGGFHPVQYYDNTDVLPAAREWSPTLIVLEIRMAERSAWENLRQLKSDPDTRDIPVLLISALADGQKALVLGAAEQVTKGSAQGDSLDEFEGFEGDLVEDADGLISVPGSAGRGTLCASVLRHETSQDLEENPQEERVLAPGDLVQDVRRLVLTGR